MDRENSNLRLALVLSASVYAVIFCVGLAVVKSGGPAFDDRPELARAGFTINLDRQTARLAVAADSFTVASN